MNEIVRKYLFNRWVAFIHDTLWVPIVLIIAYLLRFNFDGIPVVHRQSLYQLLLVAPPVQGLIFWLFGLYRGFWRFASIPDLVRILKAVGLGALVIIGCSGLLTRFQGVPRSVFVLYPLLLVGGLCGSRILFRWLKDHRISLRKQSGKRTLIVGAGRAGEMLVRDLLHRVEYEPVAFLDDDPRLKSREIHGVRVVGKLNDITQIVPEQDIDLVILAIPSAGKKVIRNLVQLCREVNVVFQTLPSVLEMQGMDVDADHLRPVTVDDLLGREPVQLDKKAISGYLFGKTVLVTGGGGSIGSELCRQVASQQPDKLIIFDHGEFNIYTIDHELRANFPDLRLETILGDVKDRDRLDWVFSSFEPDVIFHAAAYKHVPMVEENPAEGVRNNVYGTQCVADAADRYQAGRFVLVSTDKAVNPANVMGATKRAAELYCQNLDRRSETSFITTRFGNVLGSTGSVVPLFQRQIEAGGPVTVTHAKITRYFMTIPESVSLILQAGAMGQGGEIFVLDMGEPVLIKDLAEQMIRLSGLEPGKDIKVVYTGLRPGEKLYEELLHKSEGLQPTSHEKLLLARSRKVEWSWLTEKMACLRQAASSRNIDELRKCLQDVVPEFKGEEEGHRVVAITDSTQN
jgi:FlaA1/EpsC-like NDP-sugar epimerase